MTPTTLKISHDRLLEIEEQKHHHYLIYQIDDNRWLNADEAGSRLEDELDNTEELKAVSASDKSFIIQDHAVSNKEGEPARILIGSMTFNVDDDTFIFEGDQTISLSDQLKIQGRILKK